MLYLWNWILCRCWCFIPPKIRQGPTFCYSVHPKAFIKLAFIRIVELSITVLLAISPGAFIPISICLDTSWKVKFLKNVLHQTLIYFRIKIYVHFSYQIEWCPVRESYPSSILLHICLHSRSTSFPSHSAGPHSTPPHKQQSYCRSTSHTPEEMQNISECTYMCLQRECVIIYKIHTCFFPFFHPPQYFLAYSLSGSSTLQVPYPSRFPNFHSPL